ncbi:sensor histidine kinase [Thiolapillus sp.]|uniref:sensor histidine kinase n=3 Tax=Thiolapillus sp. TaxID=2017437 RepID=UPI003AF549E7
MSSMADNRGSLENALSWTMGSLLLVVLLMLLGIAAWIGRESAIQFALSRLHHDAEAILSSMDMTQHKVVRSLPPIYTQPLSGHYYMVQFGDGKRLVSRSLWDQQLVTPDKPPAQPRYWLAPGPQGQHLLIWQANYEKEGQKFSIAIAEDVAPLLTAIWHFLWIGVAASLAAVLLILLLQRLAIRRSFTRLDTIRQDVRAVRQGLRTQISDDVPAEVRPLVQEFNQLLQAWKQHQERSRNAVGNLAHALKAPLNLIYRHGEKQGETVLTEQAQQMQQLIERELKRARITGRAAIGQHFCPEQDLHDLAETVKALHHRKPLQIDLDIDAPQCIALDQNDMLELAGNLLDNAAKWAQHRIRLQLKTNSELFLSLEDDGPGIDPELREALLARGQRLDENQPGHGLGLAIVNDITGLYGGTMQLDESSDFKGLRVTIILPLS